jgi:hypothetical protein
MENTALNMDTPPPEITPAAKSIYLTYRFTFPDGMVKIFEIHLDPQTCALKQAPREHYPEWTELEYYCCANCRLNKSTHTHCPVAVSMIDVVEFFKDKSSIEKVTVSVESRQRITKRSRTLIWPGLSSLIGIYMVTSGCPIMSQLRPMVRFHLPFADLDETAYRALSMYALAQNLRHRRGLDADWEFEGLKKIYSEVSSLNFDFARRLHDNSPNEALTNAIASLDCLAQEIDFSISDDTLEEIETLLQAYL